MVARAFLDTSVLIAATFSDSGGARMVLRFGEARVLSICASRHVLEEADRVLRRKAPDLLARFAMLIERAGIEVTDPAPDARTFEAATRHPGDAQVAADAAASRADYLVTLDREHLLGNARLIRMLRMPMGTPGDFLLWFRTRVSPTAG
jgi:predicted nucleic acid-binding protein